MIYLLFATVAILALAKGRHTWTWMLVAVVLQWWVLIPLLLSPQKQTRLPIDLMKDWIIGIFARQELRAIRSPADLTSLTQ